MTISRTEPARVGLDERQILEAWLDYHRATLAMKCDGLSTEQLRERAVPPSTLSLLGLVRHMAEVERHWFQRTLAGQDAPPIYCSEEDPDGDFDHVDDADPKEAFARWHAECDSARGLFRAAPSLETCGTNWDGKKVSLRWIVSHMIEEYARHNGHADLLRQRIDGSVGD